MYLLNPAPDGIGSGFDALRFYIRQPVNCHRICVVGITIVTVAFQRCGRSMTKIAFLMDPINPSP